jgi:hypothetical protein
MADSYARTLREIVGRFCKKMTTLIVSKRPPESARRGAAPGERRQKKFDQTRLGPSFLSWSN